ncbi:regulatory protein RecX [Catellatospora sp. KI3]|uniref:regulatory protein RecX n=1 Tax=Catellatospora sp. KI3 TaxID=3041620 RepID=UPI002482BB51|nr:regulatory protein RecX [Catellatospora sp. KI3]MDI1459379.1 regulatory protein RecX [Catellatospora sp. KI3]
MAGRRRARTGRGWDAKPPAPPRAPRTGEPAEREREPSDDPTAATRPQPAPRDPYELAREICLRQLAVRPRTRSELAAALRTRGVEDEVAAAVLDRYDEVGMIDDAAFARAWVNSRHHGRGLAARALGQELRRRGVDQETVTEALSELDDETQERTAYELAERKLRTVRGEPDAVFRRVVGMLARKGYPGGVAVRAVKEALAARSAADAELAELIDPDTFDD